MVIESRPSISVVTSGEHKFIAIKNALPHHFVVWIAPNGPDEKTLAVSIPVTLDRSIHIANAKADNWGINWSTRLSNDMTRIAKDTLLERPQNIAELIDQIMSQSGTHIILRSAFTAINDHNMQSIVVDSILRTLPFTLEQVKETTRNSGIELAMNVSGGLPVEWADLFDRTIPIQRQYKEHTNGRTVVLPEILWRNLKNQTHQALITGAYPQPLQHLVNAVQ